MSARDFSTRRRDPEQAVAARRHVVTGKSQLERGGNLNTISRNPVLMRAKPLQVMDWQRLVGNRAVSELMVRERGLEPSDVVQRHVMPTAPSKLVAPTVSGAKVAWTWSNYLGTKEVDTLRAELASLIPPGGSATPKERADNLRFMDHPDAANDATWPDRTALGSPAMVPADTGIVHINNSANEYYNPDGSVDVNTVKTTLVHEAMHSVSAGHRGLQDYVNLLARGGAVQSPDEAVTEHFALQIYQKVFAKADAADYKTQYFVPNFDPFNRQEGVASATLDAAKAKQLPVAWTGQMVPILLDVLGIDEQRLKELYFNDPTQFAALVAGKDTEIKARWFHLLGSQAMAKPGDGDTSIPESYKQGVKTKDSILPLLDQVITEHLGELKKLPEKDALVEVKKWAGPSYEEDDGTGKKVKKTGKEIITALLPRNEIIVDRMKKQKWAPGTGAPSTTGPSTTTISIPSTTVGPPTTPSALSLPAPGTTITSVMIKELAAANRLDLLRTIHDSSDYPLDKFEIGSLSTLRDALGIN